MTKKAGRRPTESPEGEWERNKAHSMLKGAVQKLEARADASFEETDRRNPIRVEDLQEVLGFLSAISGDPVFRNAALAFSSYGFGKGGLKSATSAAVKRSDISTEVLLVPLVAQAIDQSEGRLSARSASIRIAKDNGLHGNDLNGAADRLRKAFGKWDRAKRPDLTFPLGDTGRKMQVRLNPTMLAARPAELDGIVFDAHGSATVPDDRRWRRRIDDGTVSFHGYISDPVLPEWDESLYRVSSTQPEIKPEDLPLSPDQIPGGKRLKRIAPIMPRAEPEDPKA